MLDIASSAVSCQPWPSLMLRWYCLTPAERLAQLERAGGVVRVVRRARDLAVGARLRCAFVTRSLMRLRSASVLRWVMPVVMRMPSAAPPGRCG